MLKSFKGLHFTILNIIALPLVGYCLIQLVPMFIFPPTGGGEAWGGVALVALLFLAILGLLIDVIIQRMFVPWLKYPRRITENLLGLLPAIVLIDILYSMIYNRPLIFG